MKLIKFMQMSCGNIIEKFLLSIYLRIYIIEFSKLRTALYIISIGRSNGVSLAERREKNVSKWCIGRKKIVGVEYRSEDAGRRIEETQRAEVGKKR